MSHRPWTRTRTWRWCAARVADATHCQRVGTLSHLFPPVLPHTPPGSRAVHGGSTGRAQRRSRRRSGSCAATVGPWRTCCTCCCACRRRRVRQPVCAGRTTCRTCWRRSSRVRVSSRGGAGALTAVLSVLVGHLRRFCAVEGPSLHRRGLHRHCRRAGWRLSGHGLPYSVPGWR